MAAWNADRVLELSRAYWECRVLLSAAELDVFGVLASGPLDAEQVAERVGAGKRGVAILLDALAGIGLLGKQDGRYHCDADVARLLCGSGPGSVLPMVLHGAYQWKKWSNLTGIVRGEIEPGRQPQTPESLRAFIEAMDVVSTPAAPVIARVVQPGAAKNMLDVGGGPGTYTAAFLRAAPQMRATLFDQPDVIEIARERLAAAGLLERVTLAAGDFDEDELPGGHDLALVSAIIHQNNHQKNVDLYGKVLRALEPGGRIAVRDHIMEAERTHPRRGAVFAINMLVSTAGGNCYTYDEIRDGLTAAGFERVRLVQPDTQMDGVVEAFKPKA
jgi:predicted O-methyltransferase YrrM